MKQILRYTFLLLSILVIGGGRAFADEETIDLTSIDGFSTWGNNYKEHKVAGSICTVTFASANKSSSTITDMPVTKGSDITINLNNSDEYEITSVSLTLKQWGTKAQTVTLNTSADGTKFTKTSTSSSTFELSASDLSAKAIKFTFSSSNNQVGVKSLTIEYKSSGKTATATSFSDITGTTYTSTVNQTISAAAGVTVKTSGSAVDGASVTYTSSNEKIATVDENGSVTTVAPGSAVITAHYAGDDTYSSSSASFTLTVKGEYSTIAEMQSAIDKLSENGVTSITADITFKDVYVTGVNGNNAYISDGSKGMLIYTDGHGLKEGNKIDGTLKDATLTLYNGAYEITGFSSSDLTISDSTLTATETAISDISAASIGNYVIIKNVTYDETKATFTDSSNNAIAYYDGLKKSVSLIDGNKYDITGVVGYHTNVQLMPTEATALALMPKFETETTPNTSLNTGTTDTYTLTYDGDGTVSVVSSDTSVATASYDSDTKAVSITAVAKGETTITISATAGANYGIPSPITYDLKVQEAGEQTEKINYSDTDIKGHGASGGKGNGVITAVRDMLTFTTTDANGNTSYLQVYGSSSFTIAAKEGYLITGVKMTATNEDYIASWKDQNNNVLKVKDTKATWTGKKTSVTITNSTNAQARLTSIEVSYLPLTESGSVEIGTDGKATYCATANCIIGDGTVAKYITGTEENGSTLTEVDAPIIAAGEGVLLSGEAGSYKVYTHAKLAPTKNANNKLVGCSSATTVPAGAYVMQKQDNCVAFYIVSESASITCPAGKAYLQAMSTEAKALFFYGDEATGIGAVEANAEETNGDIYTLSGVKVNKANLTKGIYIVNGKKYIVR